MRISKICSNTVHQIKNGHFLRYEIKKIHDFVKLIISLLYSESKKEIVNINLMTHNNMKISLTVKNNDNITTKIKD